MNKIAITFLVIACLSVTKAHINQDYQNTWYLTPCDSYDGEYSFKSGNIGHNAFSRFSISTWDLPEFEGTLSFMAKCDVESGCDYLQLYLDGERAWYDDVYDYYGYQARWTEREIQYSWENDVIEFLYTKDGSASDGYDACWIDSIVFESIDGEDYQDWEDFEYLSYWAIDDCEEQDDLYDYQGDADYEWVGPWSCTLSWEDVQETFFEYDDYFTNGGQPGGELGFGVAFCWIQTFAQYLTWPTRIAEFQCKQLYPCCDFDEYAQECYPFLIEDDGYCVVNTDDFSYWFDYGVSFCEGQTQFCEAFAPCCELGEDGEGNPICTDGESDCLIPEGYFGGVGFYAMAYMYDMIDEYCIGGIGENGFVCLDGEDDYNYCNNVWSEYDPFSQEVPIIWYGYWDTWYSYDDWYYDDYCWYCDYYVYDFYGGDYEPVDDGEAGTGPAAVDDGTGGVASAIEAALTGEASAFIKALPVVIMIVAALFY